MKLAHLLSLLVLTIGQVTAQSPSTSKGSRPLDALLVGDGLWELSQDEFQTKLEGSGIQWLDSARTRARFFGQGLSLFDNKVAVIEANCDFKDGKLASTSLSLYNRGDSISDPKTQDEFEKQVLVTKDALTAKLDVKPTDRGKDSSSMVKATGYVWSKPPTAYLLEYLYQKRTVRQEFKAEFMRLRVAPAPKQQAFSSSSSGTKVKPVAKASLVANIVREDNGDVVIKSVPMVDQGPKGYCVVATAERVFRYLGLEVDQHEMAAIAGSSASGGTSPEKMVEALKKLSGRLNVHIRELQGWDYGDFTRMINDYNRAAKKNKKKEIDLSGMRVIDIGQIYASFDPDSLKECRAADGKSNYSKFQRMVAEYVSRGIPLMWSVELGIYPETEILNQSKGGHMRLIIGYNAKTKEILFSDSWGEDHALKRMPMDNACAMTTGLYYLEPNQ